jgi:allantoin racemase
MSAARLWHQSVSELDNPDAYRRIVTQHTAQVLGTDAAVEMRGLHSGVYSGLSATGALSNAFVYHRILDHVVSNAIEAEREGSCGCAAHGFASVALGISAATG